MGKINPKGQLSGSVGRLVFVNLGNTTVVRSKPNRIKQTIATEKSANCFGKISNLDKLYRQNLLRLLPIVADKKYAYRHRTHFNRMADRDTDPNTPNTSIQWSLPQMMTGFEFNQEAEWRSVCRFFPSYSLDTDLRLSIGMQELIFKRDFRPVEKSDSITLSFYVLAVDIQQDHHPSVEICADFTMDISPLTNLPETVWTTDPLPANKLLFVIGLCKMDFEEPDKNNRKEATASCYLWADLSHPK